MSSEKRDHFLDAEESDDHDIDSYGSEQEVEKGGRSAKRRKLEDDDSDEGDVSDGEEDTLERGKPIGDALLPEAGDQSGDGVPDRRQPDEEKPKDAKRPSRLPDLSKPLSKKNLVVTEKAIKRSGVVYLSRPPPHMKPAKLRQLLEPYGAINRIFLAPEDAAAHKQRVRNGGNKKRLFTEGWVEFVDKKQAVAAVELLNGRTIGGKKGSYYRDDVWSLLYLKNFKWHNLTQTLVAENMERASRMRAEISKATKENKEFVRNVEQSKMLDGMRSKAAAKRRKASDEGRDSGGERDITEQAPAEKKRRTFKQVPVARKSGQGDEAGGAAQSEQVKRVLRKIF